MGHLNCKHCRIRDIVSPHPALQSPAPSYILIHADETRNVRLICHLISGPVPCYNACCVLCAVRRARPVACVLQLANRWLSIRLEFMGHSVVLCTAAFVTLVLDDAGLAGFALASALSIVGLANWATRQGTELEMGMNSVERMTEYLAYDSEKPAVIPGNRCAFRLIRTAPPRVRHTHARHASCPRSATIFMTAMHVASAEAPRTMRVSSILHAMVNHPVTTSTCTSRMRHTRRVRNMGAAPLAGRRRHGPHRVPSR